MLLFKPRRQVEEEIARLFHHAMPRALDFLAKENKRAVRPIRLSEEQLLEVGAGMILLFLSRHVPDPESDKQGKEMMRRAFIQTQTELKKRRVNPEHAHAWWKAFTDALIFKPTDDVLGLACKLAWEKLFAGTPYREPNALRSFGYILEMEAAEVKKHKLV